MSATDSKTVTFVQYDLPALQSGEYTITVEHVVNQTSPNSFPISAQFAVAGERFAFKAGEIHSVFPANLANGEFEGVLPHVLLKTQTLPWQRQSVAEPAGVTWLAVLLFNDDQAPTPANMTAADLVPLGQPITVAGSTLTGTGILPAGYFSYPGINPLDYGEMPDEACTVIDVPLATFQAIAPSSSDLPYLAHIREVDTTNSVDNTVTTLQYAVVLGNRVPLNNATSHAYLVSLEGFGNYLPAADGTPNTSFPAGTTTVRLLTYKYWSFVANTLDETFQTLVENLNQTTQGTQGYSSLQFPFNGTPPTPAQVQQALTDQAAGTLTNADSDVLVTNAFVMGYVPLDHRLRHAGNTVSWYRGPLTPYPIATNITVPISCPDAANKYDPQTGMFDVSYGAAWQLGQLLALQNRGFALSLFNWKRQVTQAQVIAAENEIISQKLGDNAFFESVFSKRTTQLQQGAPPVPEDVIHWLANLKLLSGVPFNYIVPDESMLPPESLRMFNLDFNWIYALVDGAFSIGRSTTGDLQQDAAHTETVHQRSWEAAKTLRRNRRSVAAQADTTEQATGFLLRSQVVAGWPGMNVNGYSDAAATQEVNKLKMVRVSQDTLLCLFDGVVNSIAIHEAPEQLHSGVEDSGNSFSTTLRALTSNTPGFQPGQQFLTDPKGGPASAAIPVRADGQTIQALNAANQIQTKLNTDFAQNATVFTAAQFALEMVKGVVEVEFINHTPASEETAWK